MCVSLCLCGCLSVYMKTSVCSCVYVNYVGVWAGFKVCMCVCFFVILNLSYLEWTTNNKKIKPLIVFNCT